MGKAGRKSDGPKAAQDTSKDTLKDTSKIPPPPPLADDECYEDGDIATPKRDSYGNDDEPL